VLVNAGVQDGHVGVHRAAAVPGLRAAHVGVYAPDPWRRRLGRCLCHSVARDEVDGRDGAQNVAVLARDLRVEPLERVAVDVENLDAEPRGEPLRLRPWVFYRPFEDHYVTVGDGIARFQGGEVRPGVRSRGLREHYPGAGQDHRYPHREHQTQATSHDCPSPFGSIDQRRPPTRVDPSSQPTSNIVVTSLAVRVLSRAVGARACTTVGSSRESGNDAPGTATSADNSPGEIRGFGAALEGVCKGALRLTEI
jgi:hypothetical protein